MHIDYVTVLFYCFLWPLLIGELFLFTRKDEAVIWRLRIALAIVLLVGVVMYSYFMTPPDELPARFLVSLLVFTKGVFLCILCRASFILNRQNGIFTLSYECLAILAHHIRLHLVAQQHRTKVRRSLRNIGSHEYAARA